MTSGTSFPIVSSNYFIDSVKNEIMMKELSSNPKFQRWINFWESKIPEIKNLIIEKTDTIKWRLPHKINLDKWFQEKIIREFTLDYSPKKDYVIDIYSKIVYEFENDTIYAKGGDIDASFQIINLTDSVQYWYTEGPYAFFDESIWLSDNICYILGFIIDANAGSYSKAMIIMWDFSKKLLIRFSSQELPLYKNYMKASTYFNYLYPEIK